MQLAGGLWLRPVEDPSEDESESLDVAAGHDRIAQVRPPVPHHVGALQQIRAVTEAKGMSEP
jgi:hypothetical protein